MSIQYKRYTNNDLKHRSSYHQHNVESQKKHGYTRYEIDHEVQFRLDTELRKGFVKVDQWLQKNDHPRLPLPAIWGYIPMNWYLYED